MNTLMRCRNCSGVSVARITWKRRPFGLAFLALGDGGVGISVAVLFKHARIAAYLDR